VATSLHNYRHKTHKLIHYTTEKEDAQIFGEIRTSGRATYKKIPKGVPCKKCRLLREKAKHNQKKHAGYGAVGDASEEGTHWLGT